jgi:RNA polymerase sigma-70 factor (ECF subfamily)
MQLTAQLLAELLDRHGAALKLYAQQWCRSPDDVVQQALIEFAGCREVPTNPAAWLFATVRRRAISRARSDKRRRYREEAAAGEWFKRARNKDEAAQLAADTLAQLPLADREVVIARFWGGLTFEEIATLTGTSTSSAQRRFEEIINRLRERTDRPCPKTPR